MARRRIPRSRWRRQRRYRRIAIASLLCLAAASLASEVSRATTAGPVPIEVAVVSRDVPSGSVLTEADVATAPIAADSPLADAALQPADVIGHSTIGALRAGEMVTGTRLLGREPQPPGQTTMPVTLADPGLEDFLEPGMIIDLVWTPDDFGEQRSEVVATGALVLQVGADGDADDPARYGAASLVLLQIDQDDAVRIAQAMASGSLSVLLRSD